MRLSGFPKMGCNMDVVRIIKVYTDFVHEVLDYTARIYINKIKSAAITGEYRYDDKIAEAAYNVLVAKKEFFMINDEEFKQANEVLDEMDDEYQEWLMYFHLYNNGFIKEKIVAPE